MVQSNQYANRVLKEIRRIYISNYKPNDAENIERAFFDTIDLFAGKREGFQRCDMRYHDLQHTLLAAMVMAQIMDGWNRSGRSPAISQKFFELGITAVLLHDSGYIKRWEEDGGTGAKYTFRHIKRSAEFAEEYLSSLGYDKGKITSVQNMIMCTGVIVDVSKINFSCDQERICGFALGTADLLGQMAEDDYVEKLPLLFEEFMEAYEYEGLDKLEKSGVIIFDSAEALIRNTPTFYEQIVKKRFRDMGSTYEVLALLSEDSTNPYIKAIAKNITEIKRSFPNL